MKFSFSQLTAERKKKILLVAIIAVVLIFAMLITSYFYVSSYLQPISDLEETYVEIPTGSHLNEIAKILEKHGVVRDATIFKYYAQFTGYNGNIQAGEYMFSGEVNPDAVLEKLAQGDVVDRSVSFTIPEGLRGDQVAERLSNQGLGDEDRFLALMNDRAKWDYWFLEDVNEEAKFYLEGYLFPDTYQVNEEASEEAVLRIMLEQFDKNFTEEHEQAAEELDMTIHELITLASIVERESVLSDERRKVAGVFYNRLSENIYLEACATVEYVLQENKPVLSDEDTKMETPYNTYQNSGLPPGPIASPGLKSIEATLNPENHDYLFFVAKHDGSRSHVFSETYQEHLQAKEEIRNEN